MQATQCSVSFIFYLKAIICFEIAPPKTGQRECSNELLSYLDKIMPFCKTL